MRQTILDDLEDMNQNDHRVEAGRRKLVSATAAVCWLVLGGVVSYLPPAVVPAWAGATVCAIFGISLLQNLWQMPASLVRTLLISGVLIWAYLIVMFFIAPQFPHATLVDR